MKRLIAGFLVILVLGVFCACGQQVESASTGTYERYNYISHNIAMPLDRGTYYCGEGAIRGTERLTLNEDGSGTYTFTVDKNFNPEDIPFFEMAASANDITAETVMNYLASLDYVLCSGDITWEAVDGCLYINGTADFHDKSQSNRTISLQYELKGKSLMELNGESSGYTRIS